MGLKNLTLEDDVVLSPSISRTLDHMDYYFFGEPSRVTNGVRLVEDQIGIIYDEALKRGLEKFYPELLTYHRHVDPNLKIDTEDGLVYYWQRPWSALLQLGFIVNPPILAKVLYDYIHPTTKENKKGQLIDTSTHIKGIAFDIGGGNRIWEKLVKVAQAYASGECFMRSYLMEKVNNAIHITCLPIN